jgi:hypothetical protein
MRRSVSRSAVFIVILATCSGAPVFDRAYEPLCSLRFQRASIVRLFDDQGKAK